jgi:hypothetical protein
MSTDATNQPSTNPQPTDTPPPKSPSSPHPIFVTQPDGTRIALRIHGGEKLHWQTDLNGFPVVRAADGRYVYATLDPQGRLKATDVVVGKTDPVAAGIKAVRPTAPATGPSTTSATKPLADPMD